MTRYVDVESPYAGASEAEVRQNILYARACSRDCVLRGETPFASHLFFTQPGILDDKVPTEREQGIGAGKAIIEALPGIVTVVYEDLGISRGMQFGIDRANEVGRKIEFRKLGEGWEVKALEIIARHSHKNVWGA